LNDAERLAVGDVEVRAVVLEDVALVLKLSPSSLAASAPPVPASSSAAAGMPIAPNPNGPKERWALVRWRACSLK
jgi:hypothetical protein